MIYKVRTQAELEAAIQKAIPLDTIQCVGYGRFVARNSAQYVAIHVLSDAAKCSGGVQIRTPRIETVEQWCDFYGIEIKGGIVVLYKALDEDFKSPHGFDCSPGTIPVAPDWDGGKFECGGGLHFSPSPRHATAFNDKAKRFCGCPVAIVDLAVTLNPDYPEKVKGRACCAPVYEVDINGKRVADTCR